MYLLKERLEKITEKVEELERMYNEINNSDERVGEMIEDMTVITLQEIDTKVIEIEKQLGLD